MSFTTATMNSGYPARDLMAALNTQLTGAGYQFVETYATPSLGAWSQIIYGGGQFVAIASGSSSAATSPDGITWTGRTLPAFTSWNSIAYGNGTYVALASATTVYATSTDGITWTARTLPLPATYTWCVTFGGGQFVALAANSNICLTSPDGITWTPRYMPVSQAWTAVTYGAGVFVATISNTSGVATSPDGISWTLRAGVLPQTSGWTGGLTYGGGLFVAVNQSFASAATSPDGITWSARVMPSPTMYSVAYGGGMYVATGSNAAASSPDGTTWTARTVPATASWGACAYGAGVFTSLPNNSQSAAAASSADGITWTLRTAPAASSTPTADVYRSPAANNAFGQDWYLILRRPNDASGSLFYQVAEGYTAATHRASTYGGIGLPVAPAGGTYANPMPPGTPDSICAASAFIALPIGLPFQYWSSVSGDRIAVGVKTTTEAGFYAGLYDDLLPAGTTGFPLVCALLPNGQANGTAIAGGSTLGNGGFTREPLQNLSATVNFEARIHNGWSQTANSVVAGNYTPVTTPNALYGNVGAVSRVMLGSARTPLTNYPGDALRGLLIGCVQSAALSVAGDAVTSGGKTYVRLAGPVSTYGIFADQAL